MNRMLLILILLLGLAKIVLSECSYQGVLYAPGSTVPVREPCLRCVCARAALQCALRVCPALPDPPPSGCILVHRRRRCCAELVCRDDPVQTNRIEARFEPDLLEIPYNESMVGNGCIDSGTVYAAGSAMLTSTRCSLCYCLAGKARCTRPRCVLPAPGCAPVYQPHACCPTRYKCSTSNRRKDDDSCLVKGAWFPAGSFVSPAAQSPCDRCYCVRGAVRCTRLHCAPPLAGCSPIIPPGECCPSSYNCSGIIEVQPLLNFDNPPELSPEYAKLRKDSKTVAATKPNDAATNYPHYILAESQQHTQTMHKTSTPYYFTSTSEPGMISLIPTSRQYVATTKHLPLEESLNLNPENSGKYSRISLTTTRRINGEKVVTKTTESADIGRTNSVLISPVYKHENNYMDDLNNDIYFDGRNNRRIDDEQDVNTTTTTITDYTTLTTEFTTDFTTETTYPTTDDTTIDTTTDQTQTKTTQDTNTNIIPTIIPPVIKLIGNNSECSDGSFEEEFESKNAVEETTVEETSTTEFETTLATTTVENTEEVPVENSSEVESDNSSSTIIPFKRISTKIDAVNKKDEDYEYDYNLQPNLEIIPFVAADAVVEQDSAVVAGGGTAYPPHPDVLRETDDPLFPYNLNLFSPPQETEGGFVPRDPPIMDPFYPYQPSNGGGASSTTNKDNSCMVFGREVQHGALTASGPGCTRCLCLFGSVMCQPPNCNDMAIPTLIMDRIDTTESTATASEADPFRDVIRTEPAPDLHSLIEDLPLYHHTQTSDLKQQQQTQVDRENETSDSIYDTLFQLLGGGTNINKSEDINSTTSTTSTTPPHKYNTNMPWIITSTNNIPVSSNPSTFSPANSYNTETNSLGTAGLLKLAGCNIYGRMYRVGKIIAELSGPCLQCRCTDTGVQCHNLHC